MTQVYGTLYDHKAKTIKEVGKTEFNHACKATMQSALNSTYGFAPALKDIKLLEASGDRTYILARIGNREYRFDSYICDSRTGSIWIGDDPVRMTAKFKWTKNGEVREQL